jgi:hypothetical protein
VVGRLKKRKRSNQANRHGYLARIFQKKLPFLGGSNFQKEIKILYFILVFIR